MQRTFSLAGCPCSESSIQGLRSGKNFQYAGSQGGIFRKAAFLFLWILLFVIPWENGVVVPGFGTLSRVVGIPAFGMALLAILECGTLRTLALQHIIMLF